MLGRKLTILLFVAAASSGCAAGTDFDDPEHVRTWANTASPLAIYALGYEPIAFADGEHTYEDPACPATSDDGTTVSIEGDCTTTTGARWVGRATIVRGGDGSRALTLSGFGHSDDGSDPPTDSGTFVVSAPSAGSQTFDVDLHRDGLTSLDVTYAGSVEGGYVGPTVWSGSGTVTRGGFADPSGTVEAQTFEQRRDDDVCSSESVSGRTTLVYESHTAVIDYDGATDCDDDHSALYAVDGDPRGTLTGVTCAASPTRRGGAPLALLGLGLVLFALHRRRA